MIAVAYILWVICLFALISRYTSLLNTVLKIAVACTLAAALFSFLFVISLAVPVNFLVLQLILLAAPAVFLLKERARVWQYLYHNNGQPWLPGRVLAEILACFLIFTVLFFNAAERWGSWDAWAIWTLHARFMLDAQGLSHLFSAVIDWSHPDYPLMLPSFIAMVWKSMGTQSALVPLLLAYGISAMLLVVIIASFVEKKSYTLGIALLLLLAITKIVYPFGAMQYADTLLGLFILLPFVLREHAFNHGDKVLFILMGFFCASAGWIKNEGIIFFLVFSFFFVLFHRKRSGELVYYLAGALLPLVIVVLFKLFVAPANDMVQGQGTGSVAKLMDVSRYISVARFFLKTIMDSSPILFVLLLFSLLKARFYKNFGFWVMGAMLAAYFFAYILTHADLTWHLETSFDRLLHQLSPALLYVIFVNLHTTYNKAAIPG
jgi:hypothetical protein